jgi:aspartate kinase
VVPEARRLAELSYEEMQELAEAGARVLNAQAVEFAKARDIALYCRAAAGGPGETVVRKFPPRTPGRVVGVTSEAGLLMAEVPAAELGALLAVLDEQAAGGKELLHRRAGEESRASLLLSLENLHDFPRLRGALEARLGPSLRLREDLGAVSAVGAGINARFDNLRATLETLAGAGMEVVGLSTSSFRISVLLPAARVTEAVRLLHQALLKPDPTPASS